MQFNLVYWHVYQALQTYESIQQVKVMDMLRVGIFDRRGGGG